MTVAPRPKPGTRPGIFDWTGAAKWDAWDGVIKSEYHMLSRKSDSYFGPDFLAAGKKYLDASAAEARYVQIASSLGWPGLEAAAPIPSSAPPDEIDLENLDDDDDETRFVPEGSKASKEGGGMGVRVSAVERDPTDDPSQGPVENSIHGFAISGNLEKLRDLVAGGADLNLTDEYVSQTRHSTSLASLLTPSSGFHTTTSSLRSRKS